MGLGLWCLSRCALSGRGGFGASGSPTVSGSPTMRRSVIAFRYSSSSEARSTPRSRKPTMRSCWASSIVGAMQVDRFQDTHHELIEPDGIATESRWQRSPSIPATRAMSRRNVDAAVDYLAGLIGRIDNT